MRSDDSLLARLKRRKLFQWALAYLAGAWLVFQGIEVLAEPWDLSVALQRVIHVLLGIGFVLTLVAAWYHGEKGRQRASGVELLILAGILVIAAAAVAALGGEGDEVPLSTAERPETAVTADDRQSIAVLPFDNLSPDPENEYFADGMHDEIIAHLSMIADLKVISRTSVMEYKGRLENLRAIAAELGVTNILEGTVRRADGQVRITTQLVDALTDEHLWAEVYDRDLSDIFAVQSDVAQQVATALRAELTAAEKGRIEERPTENLEAYDYYLRGLEFLGRSYEERDMRIAVEMFETATQLDSSFALAYARLSKVHSEIYWQHFDRSQERLQWAKQAVDRSLDLEAGLPEAHGALGWFYYHGHMDYERALQEFEIALSRQPGNSGLFKGIGAVERRRGSFQVALSRLEKAAQLDPRDALVQLEVAITHQALRDYPEAERYADRALVLAPDLTEAYGWKAWNYICGEGSTSKARAVLQQAANRGLDSVDDPYVGYRWVLLDIMDGNYEAALARLSSGLSTVFGKQVEYVPKALLAAQIYDLMNEPELARQRYDSAAALLEARVQAAPEDSRLYGPLGMAYAGLGRVEDAVRAGERGVDLLPVNKEALGGVFRVEELARVLAMTGQYDAAIDRLEFLLSVPGLMSGALLRLDPIWDPLRDQPRFQALLEQYEQRGP